MAAGRPRHPAARVAITYSCLAFGSTL